MPLKDPLTQEDKELLMSHIQRLEPALQMDLKMYLSQGFFAPAQDLLKKARERTKSQLIGIGKLLRFLKDKVRF